MAVLAVAGVMLTACATRSTNNGNDQGYGDYGSNLHRQPYTLPSQAPEAPAKEAAAPGEAPAEAPAEASASDT
jgi:hypothetical protein